MNIAAFPTMMAAICCECKNIICRERDVWNECKEGHVYQGRDREP